MFWKNIRDSAYIEGSALQVATDLAENIKTVNAIDVKVVPLAPSHLNQSDETLPATTFSFTFKKNTGAVFYGFKVNDDNAKWLLLKKGDIPLVELPVGDLNNYTEKLGFHESFKKWGVWKGAETLNGTWKYVSGVSTITAFFKGFAVLPVGETLIIST